MRCAENSSVIRGCDEFQYLGARSNKETRIKQRINQGKIAIQVQTRFYKVRETKPANYKSVLYY